MLESPTVVNFVKGILRGQAPCSNLPALADVRKSEHEEGGGDGTEPTYSLIASFEDSILSGSEHSHTINLDLVNSVAAYITWDEYPVSLRLISPTGVIFEPADTAAIADLIYESDSELKYVALAYTGPETGLWQAQITGGLGAGYTNYILDWVVDDGGVRLLGTVDPIVVDPGQHVIVTATFEHGVTPLPATVSAELRFPSGTRVPVVLEDNGSGADSISSDNTYTGELNAPTEDGVYTVMTVATALVPGGGPATRTIERMFTVVRQPDLELVAHGLRLAPIIASVNLPAEIRATVRNLGTSNADSVDVVFFDISADAALGSIRCSVGVGDSVLVRLPWVPITRGEHLVSARVELVGREDRDFRNNSIEITLPVAGAAPATTGVGEPEAPSVPRAWFGSPFPNPFRGKVSLNFELVRAGSVTLRIFDIQGRLVRSLGDESLAAGTHLRVWDGLKDDGSSAGNGLYFVQVVGPGLRQARKVVLLR